MKIPRFGLNRFDSRSVDAFAADVRRAETLGWDAALEPDSQLRRRDTYVLLAAAARATERITLGTLLANPVNRHPTVTASSIATIDELAPGRTLLGWGIGDTAVRLAGLKPARVKELEASTRLMRALLDGEGVEVGAERPARLPHHRPVPIWIAAGGPRTLRMAGGVADGVFIRVGTHESNIKTAVEAIRAGAADAGRDPFLRPPGRRVPHRARGRSGPRADDGQVHGGRVLRVLPGALRPAAPHVDGEGPGDAQARAEGLARFPPLGRPRGHRARRGFPAGERGRRVQPPRGTTRGRGQAGRGATERGRPSSTTSSCTRSRTRSSPTIPRTATRRGWRAKSSPRVRHALAPSTSLACGRAPQLLPSPSRGEGIKGSPLPSGARDQRVSLPSGERAG